MSERCADASREAGEAVAGTAVTALRWLLLEVPATWPRDVGEDGALPPRAEVAVRDWLAATPGSRLQFLRRPRRAGPQSLAFVVSAEEAGGHVRRIELDGPEELASVDLDAAGEPFHDSLVLVCAHGSRDRCCALRGTAVFGSLAPRLEDEQLWLSSHQGGHRFAANVLVLPAGLQFGRVEPDEAPLVAARALASRIELDRYRGRTCYEPRVQAAEHAIRTAEGLESVDDLRLARAENGRITFRGRGGQELTAAVEETEGPPVPASCGDEPRPQRAFRAQVL